MNEKLVLQFGEVANSTFIHFWNQLLTEKEGSESSGFAIERCMIYSQRRPMKGVVDEFSLAAATSAAGRPPNASASALQAELTGHWTDFNYHYDFPGNQYRESSLFSGDSLSAAYFDGHTRAQLEELVEEDVRRLAEACDELREIVLAGPQGAAMGAAMLNAAALLNDEYAKKRRLLLSFERDMQVDPINRQVHWSLRRDYCRDERVAHEDALSFALQALLIQDQQHCTAIPLACPTTATAAAVCGDCDFSTPSKFACSMAAVLEDSLRAQEIPVMGSFASLLLHTAHKSVDLTFAREFGPLQLPSWRRSRAGAVELVTQASFDPKPFAVRAKEALARLTTDRRTLDRLGAAELKDSITERLHELQDAADYPID